MSLKNQILHSTSRTAANELLRVGLFHTPGISQDTRRKLITAHRSVTSRLPEDVQVTPVSTTKPKAKLPVLTAEQRSERSRKAAATRAAKAKVTK